MRRGKTFSGKRAKFSVKCDDGASLDDLSMDDLMDSMDDLDDVLSARGYVRKATASELARLSSVPIKGATLPVDEQVLAKIKDMMNGTGLCYPDALKKVLSMDSDLAKRYRGAHTPLIMGEG